MRNQKIIGLALLFCDVLFLSCSYSRAEPPAKQPSTTSPMLFFCTDAKDGVWATRFLQDESGEGTFEDPIPFVCKPNSDSNLESFAAFRSGDGKFYRFFAASILDFFEYDGCWVKKGALTGNQINLSVIDKDGNAWLSGNLKPHSTTKYIRKLGTSTDFSTIPGVDTGGLTIYNDNQPGVQYVMFGVIPNPPRNKQQPAIEAPYLSLRKVITPRAGEPTVEEKASLYPREVHFDGGQVADYMFPAFTSIDTIDGVEQLTIGWTKHQGPQYPTRCTRFKFADLLSHEPGKTINGIEIGKAIVSDQLTGMTVLPSGQVIGSFGDMICNLTTGETYERPMGMGKFKFIQQAVSAPPQIEPSKPR